MRTSVIVLFFIFAMIISRVILNQRKMAFEMLKEQERFDITLRSIGDGVIVTDVKGNVVLLNKVAEKLTGFKEEEAKGLPLQQIFYIINEITREPVPNPVDKVIETGKIIGLANHTALISKDGSIVCIADSGAPIHDEKGNVVGVVLVFQDITDKKRVEDELKKSEELYRSVVEQVFDGIFLMNRNGIEFVNKQYTEITGYSFEELTSPDFDYKVLLTEESKKILEQKLVDRETGEILPAQYSYQLKHKTGKLIDVEVNTIFVGSPGYVRALGTIRDISLRKQMERKLKENERFLSNIFSSIQDGISILDTDFNIIQVNNTMEKWYSHSMPLEGKKCYQAYHGFEEPCEICPTLNTLKTGVSGFDQVPLTGKDGEKIGWLDIYSYPLVDKESGQMKGVIEYVHDITSRKKTEDSLKESEEKYRTLFEDSRDAIGITSKHGKLIYINQAMLDLFGYEKEEMIGMNVEQTYADKEDRISFQKEIIKKGSLRDYEVVLRKKNGDHMICLITSTARKDSDGNIFEHQSILRDITKQKQAERELKQSEEKYRLTAEHIPIHLGAIDESGKFTIWNKYSKKMFGYDADEIIGKQSPSIIHESKKEAEKALQIATKKGMFDGNVTFKRKDKTVFPAHLVIVPQKNSDGEIIGFYGIGEDITEKKKAENERLQLEIQIQHAQKLESLGVLAGGIAHDFNNLLMGILGNASLALMELSPESSAMSRVKHIETSALRASELTNQMLAYSGKGAFVIQRLSLSKVVREMAHLLETVISKKAILKYNFALELPSIEGDATQIRQIIMNLITNASDAIGDNSGVITITTGAMDVDRNYFLDTYLDENLKEGLYVYFEVSDTGCGMDEVTRSKIFDPFYTTKFKGRGLGLAATLGIVRGHKGAIKVYSEPNKGSTFKVLFPSLEKSEIVYEIEKFKKDIEWISSGTILVVDDDDTVRTVSKTILEKFGYNVITAKDGSEGVNIFKEKSDDILLVLLDMTMPKLSGEEAFRVMRGIKKNVCVILSSGYNEQDATTRFTGKGLAGFIQKPYRPKDLLEKIKDALS